MSVLSKTHCKENYLYDEQGQTIGSCDEEWFSSDTNLDLAEPSGSLESTDSQDVFSQITQWGEKKISNFFDPPQPQVRLNIAEVSLEAEVETKAGDVQFRPISEDSIWSFFNPMLGVEIKLDPDTKFQTGFHLKGDQAIDQQPLAAMGLGLKMLLEISGVQVDIPGNTLDGYPQGIDYKNGSLWFVHRNTLESQTPIHVDITPALPAGLLEEAPEKLEMLNIAGGVEDSRSLWNLEGWGDLFMEAVADVPPPQAIKIRSGMTVNEIVMVLLQLLQQGLPIPQLKPEELFPRIVLPNGEHPKTPMDLAKALLEKAELDFYIRLENSQIGPVTLAQGSQVRVHLKINEQAQIEVKVSDIQVKVLPIYLPGNLKLQGELASGAGLCGQDKEFHPGLRILFDPQNQNLKINSNLGFNLKLNPLNVETQQALQFQTQLLLDTEIENVDPQNPQRAQLKKNSTVLALKDGYLNSQASEVPWVSGLSLSLSDLNPDTEGERIANIDRSFHLDLDAEVLGSPVKLTGEMNSHLIPGKTALPEGFKLIGDFNVGLSHPLLSDIKNIHLNLSKQKNHLSIDLFQPGFFIDRLAFSGLSLKASVNSPFLDPQSSVQAYSPSQADLELNLQSLSWNKQYQLGRTHLKTSLVYRPDPKAPSLEAEPIHLETRCRYLTEGTQNKKVCDKLEIGNPNIETTSESSEKKSTLLDTMKVSWDKQNKRLNISPTRLHLFIPDDEAQGKEPLLEARFDLDRFSWEKGSPLKIITKLYINSLGIEGGWQEREFSVLKDMALEFFKQVDFSHYIIHEHKEAIPSSSGEGQP